MLTPDQDKRPSITEVQDLEWLNQQDFSNAANSFKQRKKQVKFKPNNAGFLFRLFWLSGNRSLVYYVAFHTLSLTSIACFCDSHLVIL